MTASFTDEEFGEISVSRISRGRHIRLSVAPNGRLKATMPRLATVGAVKRMIAGSRDEIRSMIATSSPTTVYRSGDRIGKSHSLIVHSGSQLQVKRQKLQIVATVPPNEPIESPVVQRAIRDEVKKALRKEASHYLPRRLELLANKTNTTYERVRFSHASTRWGSCSSSGTISLNIALMKLPFELIDYVLIHELSHTKQMNHSRDFWSLVQQHDPEYKLHKQQLAKQTPTI